MANYNTLLETWGATGSNYPSGYSYIEGEQPVDEWDNFLAYHSIEDIHHLVSLTNKRIESGSGASYPTSPNSSHAFYRTDQERLALWDSTASEWHGLLKSDGDTLTGDLDVGSKSLKNVGLLEMSGDADLSGNDLKDTTAGNLLYDSTAGNIPLGALEASDVTVTTGNHLSGGGTISLGGSLTVDIDDDFLLNTGDRLTGELVGERSTSSRVFTATDSATNDKLSLRISSSDTFQLVGYDSSDGAWDYNSALTYNPGTSKWSFGSLPNVNGNNVATQTWVNNSSDVPNADTVDGMHASELVLDVEEDGAVLVSSATGMDFTGHLDVIDDTDGTVTIDPTHNHDGRYARLHDGVQAPVYATKSDVPAGITKGEVVYVDGDSSLYVEDGT